MSPTRGTQMQKKHKNLLITRNTNLARWSRFHEVTNSNQMITMLVYIRFKSKMENSLLTRQRKRRAQPELRQLLTKRKIIKLPTLDWDELIAYEETDNTISNKFWKKNRNQKMIQREEGNKIISRLQ